MIDRELLKEAYLLGFMASGEGYNGEYPYADKKLFPGHDPDWVAARDDALAALAAPVSTGGDGDWVTVPREPTDDMVVAFAEVWFSKVRCIDDCQMEDAYRAMIAAAPPSDDARDAWVSVDDRRPPIRDGGDDVPVWTWDGESVKEDFYLEMHEQPLGHGGWVSIGWGFLADGGGRQATHWMPRPTPEPPAMRAQGEGK